MENDQEKIPTEPLMPTNNEEIKRMLVENQQLLEKIYKQGQKTKRYILAGRIVSFVYLLLVIIPLILAAFYLPPLLKNYMAPYQELLGQTRGNGLNINSVNDLLNQFQQQ